MCVFPNCFYIRNTDRKELKYSFNQTSTESELKRVVVLVEIYHRVFFFLLWKFNKQIKAIVFEKREGFSHTRASHSKFIYYIFIYFYIIFYI